MSDFMDKAHVLLHSGKVSPEDAKLMELVFRARSELDPLFAKAKIEVENIESLYAAFEMAKLIGRLGRLSPEEVDKLEPAIRRLIFVTIDHCIQFPPTPQGYIDSPHPHKEFAKEIVLKLVEKQRNSVAIMTFNYDLCLEIAIARAGLRYDYCLNGQCPDGHIPLLKLHGSLNWLGSVGSDKPVIHSIDSFLKLHNAIQSPSPGSMNLVEHLPTWAKELKIEGPPDPIIVPPTRSKLQHHRQLAGVWREAARHLSEAENIVVIGYSLPETDPFFRELYALGTAGASTIKRFLVYDPDTKGLESRFRALIGPRVEPRFQYLSQLSQSRLIPKHIDAPMNFKFAIKDAALQLGI